jgi:uncharacterized membrane protein YczE
VLARFAWLVLGLFLFALGIVLLLESELGLSPWDVLNQGLAEQSPLSFGGANVLIGLIVLVAAWRLGARIGLGTVANAVLIGIFVDLLLAIDAVDEIADATLPVRVSMLAAGIAAIAVGSAFYIGAAMGAGPRDSLMLVLTERTRWPVGAIRTLLEGSVTLVGFALGGTVGIGTLVFAFGIGPAIEASFKLLARSPLAEKERSGATPRRLATK